ncbi:hypothetical protein C0J52_21412 [Blattella germanica]|nr:hypothetical protein C0J52_21412 [Blattella germanica]
MQVPEKKRSIFHSEVIQTIYNVIKFYDEEKKNGVEIPLSQANARAAKAARNREKNNNKHT